MKHVINSNEAPSPRGAYSQGWRAGDFIFISGQVPRDPVSGDVLQGPLKELTIRALKNIDLVLATEGSSLKDVIKFTVIVQDLSNIRAINDGFREILGEPLPARTTFQGGLMGVPLEIDAIAYQDSSDK